MADPVKSISESLDLGGCQVVIDCGAATVSVVVPRTRSDGKAAELLAVTYKAADVWTEEEYKTLEGLLDKPVAKASTDGGYA